jgi:hypothetical protein
LKIFAKNVTAEEVIKCIKTHIQLNNSCRDGMDGKEGQVKCNDELERLDSFVDKALFPLLRSMSSEKLSNFVEFCTGYHYIPDVFSDDTDKKHEESQRFVIGVELNQDEGMDEESLPVSHTCIKTLKLPWGLYGGDRDKFAAKLDMAMDSCVGVMTMN